MITKIHNAEEWDKFYYYAPYKPKKYPERYPCFAKQETYGGGIVGEAEGHYVIYPPDLDSSLESAFLEGLDAQWEFIC